VATIFQANALVQGTLEVAGHRVDPAALRQTALLTVEGAEDDISALCQTEAAHDLCPNIPEAKRARLVVPKAGHFALFYGRAMRAQVIPAVSHIMAAAEGG
jgi:poly(3-hydroxybutyrate) depolymerase